MCGWTKQFGVGLLTLCLVWIAPPCAADVGAPAEVTAPAGVTVEQQRLLDQIHRRIEEHLPLPAYCVKGPITPEATEFIREVLSYGSGFTRFNGTDSNRWMSTAVTGPNIALGQPMVLTWSIVPDGLNVDGASSASDLKSVFDAAFGSRAAWESRIAAVFDEWAAKTGIQYVQVSDDGALFPNSPGVVGTRGDIRIGGTNIDGAGDGILAFNYFPNGGGDMVFDTSNTADTFAIPDDDFRLLKNVASHEHGHGLGFGHACPLDDTKIMEPKLAREFDHSGLDDIANANRKYADPYESLGRNDTFGTATQLGPATNQTLGYGSDAQRQVASIDSTTDSDFYAFDLNAGDSISFHLKYRGGTYEYADDNGSLCDSVSTSPLALKAILNLNIQFLDVDGFTVIDQASNYGAGYAELIQRTIVPITGTYYVRVYSGGIPPIAVHDQVQLYTLEIRVPGVLFSSIPSSGRWSVCIMVLLVALMGVISIRRVGVLF